MRTFVLDAETYYSREYTLRTMTPAEYILDPQFELIGLAAMEMGHAPFWVEGPEVEAFLASLDPADTITISHNALFDNCIWAYRFGWVPALMNDTLGMARAVLNLKSNSLEAVAKVLRLGVKGKEIGQALGMRLADLKARPEFYKAYIAYSLNDTVMCGRIYETLIKAFPKSEIRVQDLVLRAAVEPVLHADVPLLEKHLTTLRHRKARLLRESDCDKAALMSTQKFREKLEELGVVVKTKISPTGREVPAFAKTDPFMNELQEYDGSPNEDVNYMVQTLAAARLSHKSTIEETRCERFLSIAKLPWRNGQPMLPVPLRYGGAHTHRLSGEWRMNLQNLPRDNSSLRKALVAPPGHKIISADLAQIEARIVARICEQKDLLTYFRNGEDVYAIFAQYLFRKEITKESHPDERWIGKTAILGLGYGCGHVRFNVMVLTGARRFDINLKDIYVPNNAEPIVNAYRKLFPKISRAWTVLQHKLDNVLNGRSPSHTSAFGPVWFFKGRIRLPNGLYLRYDLPDQTLYGAKLLENITQALARNVIMEAAVRLADRGYRFALQAHDELVFVVPDDEVEEASSVIMEEMTRVPDWIPALPLAAEIGVGANYGEAK